MGFCPRASCDRRLGLSGGFTQGTKHLKGGVNPGENSTEKRSPYCKGGR